MHKAERQLLYDRVSSINVLLEKLEKDQFINYIHLREPLPEDNLFTCTQIINVIKEHRHDKIKSRQIDKFEQLLKKSGYHHNQQQNLDGHHTNSSLTTTTNVV